MELKELKNVFDSGGLKSAIVYKAVLVGGYILVFKDKNGNSKVMTSQRDVKGHPRGFKTIDAAVKNAQKVGFKTVTVDLI